MKLCPSQNNELTVAGEATSRSMGSNIRLVVLASWMISPLIRHSFLLSSNTVFMFSIQMASTGPSKISHFLSGVYTTTKYTVFIDITPRGTNLACCTVSRKCGKICVNLIVFLTVKQYLNVYHIYFKWKTKICPKKSHCKPVYHWCFVKQRHQE